VISETAASNLGLGYLMISAASRLDVPLVFAGLLVVSAMGIGLYLIFATVEQKILFPLRGE
jgi:NitT/TauT family transport system permease protein